MNTRQVAIQAYTHIVCLTLMVMGTLGLATVFSSSVTRYAGAMPASSVMVILAGAALFFKARGMRWPRVALSGALAGFAAWSLWRYSWMQELSAPPGAFTLAFFLLALATVPGTVRKRWRLAGMLMSAAVIVLPLLSLASAWFPALPGMRIGVGYHVRTAEIIVLLAATASFLLSRFPARGGELIARRLLALALCGVVAYVGTWFLLSMHAIDTERRQSSVLMRGLQDTLSDAVLEQLTLMNRMAERWNASGAVPSPALWQAETNGYLRDVPGLERIAVINASRSIIRIQDPGASGRLWLDAFLASDGAQAWLDRVESADAVQMSHSYADSTGVRRNLIAVALQAPSLKGWTLVGAQNLPLLLRNQLGSVPALQVKVYEGNQLLFQSHPQAFGPNDLVTSAALPVQQGLSWTVSLRHGTSTYRSATMLANAMLLTGLTLMVFLLVSQRLASDARRNAEYVTVQRDTMALIARTDHLPTMLAAICTMVERREPRAICTIHALSEDGQRLELLAAGSMPEEIRQQLSSLPVGEGVGASGTAAFRRDMVIVPDITTHPFWHDYHERVAAHGMRACYASPVMSLDGSVLGTVALYVRSPGLPSAEQQQLMASTAQFAAVAIERVQARIRVRASEQRYRSLYQFNPDTVYSLDTEGRFTSINPAGEQLSGFSEAVLLGMTYRDIVIPEEHAHAEAHFEAALAGEAQHYETVGRDRYGNRLDLEITNMPIEVDHQRVGVFGIAKDVSERKRTELALQERNHQLAHNANHDMLTGLPNRRLLEVRLRQACAAARPDGFGVAVVFFDLDGFKPINDSMGHSVGDQILMEVAHRMQLHVRAQDTVARLSGDEFVMVLHGLSPLQAERITQRAINAVGQPYTLPQGVQHITVSAGIAFTEQPVQDPMHLVQAADLAMYKAKREGRNNYQWHTDDMSRHVRDRLRMRNDLRRALETSGLTMHYQPKFDRSTRKVVGIEALARWNHPEHGPVSPDQFIAVAEETGQIIALGAWAMQTACSHNHWLIEHGLSEVGVAVNISAVQFQRESFVQEVMDVLEKTGLSPGCL
nr:diguanylate cyclase [Pseudomonas sp.]